MYNKKTLVLGNGFVGKQLALCLMADTTDKRLHELTEADIAPYDFVINTAAKTAIDWCEKNREETFDTNVLQAIRIAKLTKGKYVFMSSACIFKSDDQYQVNYEDATPNPQCFYTYTKLMAEQLLEEIKPDTLIIRPRLLISEKSHPRNTLDKLLKYDKVLTTQESATILEDMISKIITLMQENASGAYNIFNEGTISPSEIMDIFQHSHTKITKQELDELTKDKARRVSTILGTKRTTPMRSIRDRIVEIRNSWYINQK